MVSTRKEELIAILDHFNIQVIAKFCLRLMHWSLSHVISFVVLKELKWTSISKLTIGQMFTTIVSEVA